MDEEATNDELRIKKCLQCQQSFFNLSSLRRHVRKFHPDKIQLVASRPYTTQSSFKYSCEQCGKNFNHQHHFKYHKKTHGPLESQEEESPTEKKASRDGKKCPMCSFTSRKMVNFLKHFEQVHEVPISCREFEFSSMDNFSQWMSQIEKETHLKFVKKLSRTYKTHQAITYACHRSGFYVPEGKGLRNLKMKGSVKINGYCPANIQLIKQNTGKCHVKYTETHIGHSSEADLGYLYLTKEERRLLAMKIASKVPFDDILDEIRDSISNENLERMHLLKRKDLYNIERCFNLSTKSMRHSNDAISVEAWVNEMKDKHCVIFYKPQGITLQEYPTLKSEDFVLSIMTSAQCELLKKYGTDCICVDGTHGLNSYNFELHTLLVLDDLREGFPCAFLISNRSDTEVLKIFFGAVKEQAGTISTGVFMTDLTDVYSNAWNDIMGVPANRLYCTWHLDRAWRKNLPKIKEKEKQVTTYKQLRTLLQERDQTAFHQMLSEFCAIVSKDPETKEFGKYFMENYLANFRFWAYSYRLHLRINTNMHLERMHGTIKHIYLQGKRVKRLDKAIAAIMRFVRDKLIDRLIVINKGKICSKIKNIRSRHKSSLCLDPDLIIRSEYGWEISSEKQNEIYSIQESAEEPCTCQLICGECDICIHRYCCSCIDSSIKFNMCKHIHLLARYEKAHASNEAQQNIEIVPNQDQDQLHIHEEKNPTTTAESGAILRELSHSKTVSTLDEEKENIKMRFLNHLEKINSPTKMDAVKRMLAPLSPTLAAIENFKCQSFATTTDKSQPHNTKIQAQRALWSTKKKRRKVENCITKPTAVESQNICISLLHSSISVVEDEEC